MDSFWNHIDEHRKSYLTLYYQALALKVREEKEKEANNLKPVVKVKISDSMAGNRHESIIAEDTSNQHGAEPPENQRCLSPDNHPE